ncbi:MAG: hypothetical protein CMH41_10340 [Micrococcales bacterium]|nr:hypothetical protein [Micrococcales bacterium]
MIGRYPGDLAKVKEPRFIMISSGLSDSSRSSLIQRARLLAMLTVGYNVIESVVALSAGNVADSGALIGFGLDSLVEVSSGLVILWQFRGPIPEAKEKLAGRLIAVCFLGLALYVGTMSLIDLATGREAQPSQIGIVLAIASIVIMPYLAFAQRATGKRLSSNSVVANSKQTFVCSYLSLSLLMGLGLNAWLGWWWADPIAALTIAALAGWEGYRTWQGDQCCAVDPAVVDQAFEPDVKPPTNESPQL